MYAIVTGVGTGPVTERSAEHRDFFISRAGENAAVARASGVLTFPEGEELAKVIARTLDGKVI